MSVWMTAVILLAAAQWIVFMVPVVLRGGKMDRQQRSAALLSTGVLTVAALLACAGIGAARHDLPSGATARTGPSCARINEGMDEPALVEQMGEPSRRVSEAPTRGPGAEAFVYEDAQCVAHVLDGRVRSVTYASNSPAPAW